MSEAYIRDLLACDLSVLQAGLELLEVEKFIPSTLGTRSFLDLLAKDRSNHWVIIEIKKTNASAREAAHEVFKYAEAVQRHLGVRNDEMRVIVAAVEWKELLIPFSRLKAETSISIEGFHLEFEVHGGTLTASRVECVPVNQGRYLAPWHELNMYHSHTRLDEGIASYDKCCKDKGIEDYVLVILKCDKNFNERAAVAAAQSLQRLKAMYGVDVADGDANLEPLSLPRYEFVLYFAPQIFSKEFCLAAIARDPEQLEEVLEYIESMSEEEELCALHESVYGAEPCPDKDHYEIGYAGKLQHLIIEEMFTVERVLRRGLFARNKLLSDDVIVDELRGYTGSSGQLLRRTIDIANGAHIASARTDLANALKNNPSWLAQLNRAIDEVSRDTPKASVEIRVYCPSAGVFTLYFIATQQDPQTYVPCYEVAVKDDNGNVLRCYLGLLLPAGKPLTFNDILQKYYEGQMFALMFLAGARFYEARDADVLDDLGLTYKSFRIDNPTDGAKWFELKNERWKSCSPFPPFQPLQAYFKTNNELISSIVNEIGSRMLGGFHAVS